MGANNEIEGIKEVPKETPIATPVGEASSLTNPTATNPAIAAMRPTGDVSLPPLGFAPADLRNPDAAAAAAYNPAGKPESIGAPTPGIPDTFKQCGSTWHVGC